MIRKFRRIWKGDSSVQAVMPAPLSRYEVRPLTLRHLEDVCRLNRRCFPNGENYTRHTFSYLLSEPNSLSFRAVTPSGAMVGFIVTVAHEDGAAHVTTIGVAPEHRRRGLAKDLLRRAEIALAQRRISTVRLEVRVSNIEAQSLYRRFGYAILQRLPRYYVNKEDGFLMVKSIV